MVVVGDRRSCSHIRNTAHPCFRNCFPTARSRATFRLIFSSQNSRFCLGIPRCLEQPCQKHPSTNTANLEDLKTKSGLPNSTCRRRHPVIPCILNSAISRSSVERFPWDRILLI